MTTPTPAPAPAPAATPGWIYLKLYLGRAVDRMDPLLVDLAALPALNERAQRWFFIRYVDERGIHIRLRALPQPGDEQGLRRELIDLTARRLGRLHEVPAGDYFPMVAMPGFEEAIDQISAAHQDVDVVEAAYEPEHDKFGEPGAIEIAEALFHASSLAACRVLDDDGQGRYSRKDLVPLLLDACYDAFLPADSRATFWREYSYYWLKGKSLAADDWRMKFHAKARELAGRGIAVLRDEDELPTGAAAALRLWREALQAAAAGYARLGRAAGVTPEVLCFNVAHLMNNRLGLGTLEEAYMGALLEAEAESARELEAA